MKLLLVTILATSCGGNFKASGGTTHKVEGKAEIVQRIVIDIEICNKIQDPEKQAECIDRVLSIAEGIDKPQNISGSF